MNILLAINAGSLWVEIGNFIEFAKTAFYEFSFTDALDILLLTVFFTLAVKFLRGRKAGALIIGTLLCLVVFVIALMLGLSGVRFILSGIFQIGALAVIIIFQPEIRDALERLGSGSIYGILTIGEQKRNKEMYYRAIDAISSAIRELSASKTGALIVIGRTTQLDEVVETGITINADVNSYLLRNLFFNKAPLHDGAVVIDGGRILAAGCLLPLTRRSDVDSDLGTRHRAALGMSESSDAIIIVVSEETGIISVAHDCTLTRNFTAESLRKYLMNKILRTEHTEDEGV